MPDDGRVRVQETRTGLQVIRHPRHRVCNRIRRHRYYHESQGCDQQQKVLGTIVTYDLRTWTTGFYHEDEEVHLVQEQQVGLRTCLV